jgi:ParB family chromosome partitioning protein
MNAAPGTLIHLNPAEIATDKNIRKDLQITPDWVKNLKQHGVRQPISAYWDSKLEQYQVEAGHRRTVGAVEAGLETIPVYIVDAPDDIARTVDQMVENVHREPLRPVETAAAYKELALFGLPAMAISQRTNTKLAKVGDAIAVAGNPVAASVLEQHQQLTIDDALVFAEFDGDDEAIATLTETVTHKPGQLPHIAQQLRDDRDYQASRVTVQADLERRGIPVLDARPGHRDPSFLSLDIAYTNYEKSKKAQLANIPSENLAAFIGWNWQRLETGRQVQRAEVEYYVKDWKDLGLETYPSYSSAAHKGPLTDAEKADRAKSRENSKLWASATAVRLAWVKELLQRRSLPKDAAALAALWAAKLDHAPNRTSTILTELIGVERKYAYQTLNAFQLFAVASPDQGLHVVLAVAVAAIEGSLDEKKGWEGGYTGLLPYYLKQLSAWGYPLSELEQSIVRKHDAEQAKAAKKAAA